MLKRGGGATSFIPNETEESEDDTLYVISSLYSGSFSCLGHNHNFKQENPNHLSYLLEMLPFH